MTEVAPDSYIEAKVSVPREFADAVCNYIVEHIASGLVLEEEEDSPETGILFYVPEDKGLSYRLGLEAYLRELIHGLQPTIQERPIKNVEWVEQYKASIKSIWITDDVVVRPNWEAPTHAQYEIVLEPKMAFGTGSHETTRSCMKLIREQLIPGARFLDLGTGSGILSILASKMGASFVKAIDYDLAAVENSRENFEINGITTPHEILFGSIEKCHWDEAYDMVVANIIKTTILPMIPRLFELTAKGGTLILSGLLPQDEEEITAAIKSTGHWHFSIVVDNKWLTYSIKHH